jgi:hypothetical protein
MARCRRINAELATCESRRGQEKTRGREDTPGISAFGATENRIGNVDYFIEWRYPAIYDSYGVRRNGRRKSTCCKPRVGTALSGSDPTNATTAIATSKSSSSSSFARSQEGIEADFPPSIHCFAKSFTSSITFDAEWSSSASIWILSHVTNSKVENPTSRSFSTL